MKRRTVLATTGTLLGGLAGCLGGAPGNPGTESPTETPTETPTEPPTEAPAETPTGTPSETPTEPPASGPTSAFDVVRNQCGTERNSASVEFRPDGFVVEGTIDGRNTCYTARLRPLRRRDGTLVVPVVAALRESTGTAECGQCLVDIDYRVTVADAADIDEVVVTHDGDPVQRANRP